MTRGGKRLGAGRPVTGKPKKMYSFRLSEEEVKKVKELLAQLRGKAIILLMLMLFSLPAFCAVESTPTIDHRNWKGYGVAQYGTRDDNEYSTKQYRYSKSTKGSKEFYLRDASLLSRPCRDIQANGVVYEEPNCRIQEDGSYWHSIIGWSVEDSGTIVEYDTRWWIEILRLNVYAIDNNGNVGKFKITENKHKNVVKQKLYGSYDTYEQISYFVQTANNEITEYNMDNKVISIYRKNQWQRINEYEADGKTLRTYHDTKYLPYLQWEDTVNKRIYKHIDDFEAKLFDR